MNTARSHTNITPRRSKALPIVMDSKLWKCILVSKESNHGRWSLFWWWNNTKKDRGGRITWQEKSSDAVVREIQEELWKWLSVWKIQDLWTIITDKKWKIISHRESKRVKQRIFALLVEWCTQKDDSEIEAVWLYPIEEKYSAIRREMRKNMDEFAQKALIDYRKKLSWPWYEAGDVSIQNSDRKIFDDFISELWFHRSIISRILNW